MSIFPTIVSGKEATTFTIKVVTGASAGSTLTLSDRCLPYRGYALPSSMRVQKTYYPGNPIATVQVLGSQEDDTTINGYWKQRFLTTTSAVWSSTLLGVLPAPLYITADLVTAVQNIKDMGQLVEVLWGETVRKGVIIKFTPKWNYGTDCEWELVFSWISRGQKAMPNILSNSAYFAALGTQAISSVSVLKEARKAINAATMPSDWLDGPLAFIDGVKDSTQIVQNGVGSQLASINAAVSTAIVAANAAQSVATLPANIGNAIAGTLSNQAANISNAAQSISYRSQLAYTRLWDNITASVAVAQYVATSVESTPATLAAASKAAILYTAATMSRIRHLSLKSRRTMIDAVSDYRGAQTTNASGNNVSYSNILAVYTAKANDDLRRVAIIYYGSQTGWQGIQQYNGLTTPILNAGQLILIPVLSGAA